MIGWEELIIPALILLAIFIFVKIYKNKSPEIAKKAGKIAFDLKKASQEIPKQFKEGMVEAEKENASSK